MYQSEPGIQLSCVTYMLILHKFCINCYSQLSWIPIIFPQHISEPVLPLSAFLLSEHVERVRDKGRQEGFRVRTLFHRQSDTRARGTCITLHAFKDTEEHKATCLPQVRTRVLSVLLTLSLHHFQCPSCNPSNCPSCFQASSRAVHGDPDSTQWLVWGSTHKPIT